MAFEQVFFNPDTWHITIIITIWGKILIGVFWENNNWEFFCGKTLFGTFISEDSD